MSEYFDPYYTWLGIPPEEQPADHYRLLGIRRYESNAEVILNASDQRMAFLRTVQHGARMKASQDLLNEISATRARLLDPQRKAAYDSGLRSKLARQANESARQHEANLELPAQVPAPVRTIADRPVVADSPAISPDVTPRSVTRRSLATTSAPRRKYVLAIEMVKIVAGGATGLALGAVLLWYLFQIDVLSSLSSPRSSDKLLVDRASPTLEPASRTGKIGSASSVASPKLANSSDTAARSNAVETNSGTARSPANSVPVDGAQRRSATVASSVGKPMPTAATLPERDAKAPASPTAVIAPSAASRQPALVTTVGDSLPSAMPQPRAAMLAEIRTAQEAIAELKKAGLQISDSPEEVQRITTQGVSFGPDHAPLLGLFPNLRHLALSSTPAAPAILEKLPHLSTVQSLQFENTPITDEDLVHLRKFPGLLHLSLHGTKVKGPGLEHLRHVTLLNNLQIPHDVSRDAVPLICQIHSLQYVQPWPRGLTDDDFREIAKLTRLRSLTFLDSTMDVSSLTQLQGLKELETIDWAGEPPPGAMAALSKFDFTRFNFPPSCSDADLACFRSMPRLASVFPPWKLSNEGLATLAEFAALQQLFLRHCTHITDDGLVPLAASKTLDSLYLPRQITDDGLRNIAAIATLHAVHLPHDSCVTDRGVAELERLPRIQSLTLGSGLTDLSAGHLIRMPALDHLTLQGTPFSAKAFQELRKLPALRYLNLSRVPIDDDAVLALQNLPHLENLFIQQHKFTPERRAAIRRALPRAHVTE